MKLRILICLLISLISTKLIGQFSGTISYKELYEIKQDNPFISPVEFGKAGGDQRTLQFRGSSFKISTNGTTKFKNIVYMGEENRLYYYGSNSDTLYWIDASYDTGRLISDPKIETTSDSIIGLLCRKIILKTKFTTITYYYSHNSSLALNPREFEHDHFQFWNIYVKYAKAVPLKYIVERKNFRYTSIAISINQNVEKSSFILPDLPKKQNRLRKK